MAGNVCLVCQCELSCPVCAKDGGKGSRGSLMSCFGGRDGVVCKRDARHSLQDGLCCSRCYVRARQDLDDQWNRSERLRSELVLLRNVPSSNPVTSPTSIAIALHRPRPPRFAAPIPAAVVAAAAVAPEPRRGAFAERKQDCTIL